MSKVPQKSFVLSFTYLNDLRPSFGPKHWTIKGEPTYDNILNFLKKIEGIFKTYVNWYGVTSFDVFGVASDLSREGYYVWNRYEKYYVIAFAINYKRFNVYSRDYDAELITWRDNDYCDEIVDDDSDEDYNVNPVVKLLSQIN